MPSFRFNSRLIGTDHPAINETWLDFANSSQARSEAEKALCGLCNEAIAAQAGGAEIDVFDGDTAVYWGRVVIEARFPGAS